MHTEQEGRLVPCVGTGRKQCWVPHTQGVKTMETMGRKNSAVYLTLKSTQTEEIAGMAVSLSPWVDRPGKQWVDRNG